MAFAHVVSDAGKQAARPKVFGIDETTVFGIDETTVRIQTNLNAIKSIAVVQLASDTSL